MYNGYITGFNIKHIINYFKIIIIKVNNTYDNPFKINLMY